MQSCTLFRITHRLFQHRTASVTSLSLGSFSSVSHNSNRLVTCSKCYSTTNKCLNDKYNPKDNHSKDNHEVYLEQMMELEQEREQLFGTNDDGAEPLPQSRRQEPIYEDSHVTVRPTLDNGMCMEERNEERDLIYNFTPEETQAWANHHTSVTQPSSSTSLGKIDSKLMNAIHQIRAARDEYEDKQQKQIQDMQSSFLKEYMVESSLFTTNGGSDANNSNNNNNNNNASEDNPMIHSHAQFTHLNQKGDQVSMVDVGNKSITRRVAKARSSVYLPPEVMDAFATTTSSSSSGTSDSSGTSGNTAKEMMSTKGPIFSTARIAGIMGAKRTSDLIPLCHPLPLDNVHIDIWLDEENSGNRVIVECTCSVTHTTGVEMEALTGASVAALTIYDMVKAVSHRVRIENTELIRKSGGKRDVNHEND